MNLMSKTIGGSLPGLDTRALRLSCGCLLLAGCVSQTPVPALIEVQSQNAREQKATTQALEVAASTLLNGSRVKFAASAFTQAPRLSLAPAIRNTPQGRLATGRTIVLPDELLLLRIGRRCELMKVATEERAPLPGVACKAAD